MVYDPGPMSIDVRASVRIARPRAEVFAAAAGKTENLVRYFSGYAPLIPGIAAASLRGAASPGPGVLRDVKLSDGTAIVERITAFDAPSLHAYDMAEMNTLQRLLCTNMESRWRFEDDGDGTRVTWDYRILPRSVLHVPLAWVTGRLFERAMQRCLDALARDLSPA